MKSYGFTIEFKRKNYKVATWKNHWNHKVYETEDFAKEAIEQMKKAFDFYRENYDWRIIELFIK